MRDACRFGRVVYYVESNLDGSKPALVSIDVARNDRIGETHVGARQ